MRYPENELELMREDCGKIVGPQVYDWMRDMVLYEVYPRSFSPEGNFAGITKNLDKIQDLGVNDIWLMPIHPIGKIARKGDLGCPYSISDHMGINPEYGSGEDFRELVKEAHSRGMRVFIDIVVNHGACDNVNIDSSPRWFSRDSQGALFRRYADWSDVVDFDYRDRGLWEYIKQMLIFWVEKFDVDGYRCDVAGMVPLEFWEESLREIRRIKPQFYMLAEWDASPHLCREAFNSDYRSDIYRHMVSIREGSADAHSLVEMWADMRKKYPQNNLPLNFIENHDQKRAVEVFGEGNLFPWATFIFTLPGIPLLYNGQEIGCRKYSSLFEKEPIDWRDSDDVVYKMYKSLIEFRKNYPAVRFGEVIPLKTGCEKQVAGYRVKYNGNSLVCFLNLSDKGADLNLGDGGILLRPGEIVLSFQGGEKVEKTLSSEGFVSRLRLNPFDGVIFDSGRSF